MTPDRQAQFDQVRELADKLIMVCESTRLQNLDTKLLDKGMYALSIGVTRILTSIEGKQ